MDEDSTDYVYLYNEAMDRASRAEQWENRWFAFKKELKALNRYHSTPTLDDILKWMEGHEPQSKGGE